MTLNRLDRSIRLACAVPLLAWATLAGAQAPAAGMTPLTGSATSMTQASPPPAATPASKPLEARSVRRTQAAACEAVNDPWENLCTIRKHAQIACSDLSTGAAKSQLTQKARKARAPAAVAGGNPRQDCVDAYMRNV